jgi:hypothetical protein
LKAKELRDHCLKFAIFPTPRLFFSKKIATFLQMKIIKRAQYYIYPEPVFVNLEELRIRFPAWRAGATSLLEVPLCQPAYAGGINSWAP